MRVNKPPAFEKKTQSIGIIALSSACEEARFKRGLKFLEDRGYRVKVALDPCRYFGKTTHLFSSDSAKARAEALKSLYVDDEVGAIIAARGAYGCVEILPLLDFGVIPWDRKPLVGFSDTTALFAPLQNAETARLVHGPSIESAFSQAADNEECRKSAEALLECLEGRAPNPLANAQLETLIGDPTASAEGILKGGNLSILCSLIGTAWECKLNGDILFLEESNERPYRIHRMLTQMKLSGALGKAAGVLLGSFTDCEHPTGQGPSLKQVFDDVFSELGIPVRGFAPCGHAKLNLPLPLNVKARLSKDKLELL